MLTNQLSAVLASRDDALTETVYAGLRSAGVPLPEVMSSNFEVTGYDFGGIVGYDFGGFRLEAETSYRHAGADSLNTGTTQISGSNLDGSASALSFMMNGLLDFGPDDGLQGFVGGGAGVGAGGYAHADETGQPGKDPAGP